MDGEKNTFPSLNNFVNETRRLLKQEQQAEMQAFQQMTSHKSINQIQDEGAGLSNMMVINSKDGFYGKIIITLAKSYSSEKNPVPLPEYCKLGVGDDVAIYSGNTMVAEGVIYRRGIEKVKISIRTKEEENNIDLEGDKVNIVMKWNQVTYRRYFSILDTLSNPNLDFPISNIFFKSTSSFYVPKKVEIAYKNPKMNDKQNQAIANGLIQQSYLIHGPPGTGKTTTVCQLIVESVGKGQKVLACAPSNIAVDNLVQGICNRVNCVRIGNPARVIGNVIERCLDFLIGSKDSEWKGQEKKLNALRKKLKRCDTRSERKQIQNQIKGIRAEIQTLQEQVIEEILKDADVICATNAGAADRIFKKYLNKRVFDLVVIDECGQGLEVSCWIPLIHGRRVVLAGDHKQLPPTVKFQTESLLSYTLFSRAMEELKYIQSTMLEVQYRMNRKIMGWSNKQFYENRLQADKSVESHTLQEIYNGVDEEETVILMIDTAGCQMGEEGGSMESKFNQGQADVIMILFEKLLKYGVQSKDIAILTPYSKQVTLIKNLLATHQQIPQVSTVDGIQGRQKQCILISLVRSNREQEIGFLKDWRRINVAVTRARRMLIIVGDSDTVTKDPKIHNLVEWIGQEGAIQSAEEFRNDDRVRFGIGNISDPKRKNDNPKQKKKNQNKNNKNQKKQEKPQKQKIQPKLFHTEEQQNDSRDQYRAKLINLSQTKVFHNVNAYERKMIHQVAQEFNYSHITSEDKQKITVSLKNKIEQRNSDEQQQKVQVKKNKKNKKKQEKKVSNTIIPTNMKELIGQQSSDNEDKGEIKVEEKQKVKEEVRQKKKKKKKQEKKEEKEEDWEKLLDEFTSDMPKKDQCYKCGKKITSVTSTQCKYCKLYFCRHDLLAQEHGCEDQARQYARSGGNVDRFLEIGTRKIQQKLKQQQDKRKKKQKGKQKQKK